MAQIQADGGFDAPENGIAFGTMANLAGAAVSLVLLVGVGVWGYQLVTRDVSGIPVVRAAEGPMRIQPENPGGAAAANQGLAVNAVAAVGSAEKPADELILAPKPISLSNEDKPLGQLPKVDETEVSSAPQVADETMKMSVEDLVASLTKDADPLEEVTPASVPAPAVASKPEVKIVSGGIGRSLRPSARPAGLKPVRASAPSAIASASGAVDVDAASLPAGTRLAQLGAYESAAVARTEWDRLFARFGDYMHEKKRVIQKAESGGRTFYRLRAHGFADINDARRFCSALVAEKAECIPVTTR
ncbi:SPOR domain-containing protein [Thalassovita sp.]|uniref:SPOR domain-containing protein n=1 Tax=Thalassovita sp. TaxID=1979401 RepID=UPI003B5C67D1